MRIVCILAIVSFGHSPALAFEKCQSRYGEDSPVTCLVSDTINRVNKTDFGPSQPKSRVPAPPTKGTGSTAIPMA